MKRLSIAALVLFSAQLHLCGKTAAEDQAAGSPTPGQREAPELCVNLLYSDTPAARQRPDPGLAGDWDAKLGGELSVRLRIRMTEEGFTGTLEYEGEGIAPLIKREVVPGGLKFAVPLETDAGEIAFELALDSGALKGHMIVPEELGGRDEIRFARVGAAKKAGAAKEAGGANVAGKWKGCVDGSEPVEIRLKEEADGLAGSFSMSILGDDEVQILLADAHRKGERVCFAVREDGEVIWAYELVVEGDVLTGYQRGEEGRKWVAFRRIP